MFFKRFLWSQWNWAENTESPVVTWGSLVWLMLFCHSWKLNSNQQFFSLEMIFQNHSLGTGVLLALGLACQFWSCIFLFKSILFFLLRHSKDFFFFFVFLRSLLILSQYLGIGCSGWCSQVHFVLFKNVGKIFRRFFLKYSLCVGSVRFVWFSFSGLNVSCMLGLFCLSPLLFFLLDSF